MKTIAPSPNNTRLAALLWLITDFCLEHRGKRVFIDMSRSKVFRYIAFCYFTGRLAFTVSNGRIVAIAVTWSAWREHVELNFAENRAQFEWREQRPGDCLFVAEVIGSRRRIGDLWQNTVEAHPHLLTVPLFTYRRDKLVRLQPSQIERFCGRWS